MKSLPKSRAEIKKNTPFIPQIQKVTNFRPKKHKMYQLFTPIHLNLFRATSTFIAPLHINLSTTRNDRNINVKSTHFSLPHIHPLLILLQATLDQNQQTIYALHELIIVSHQHFQLPCMQSHYQHQKNKFTKSIPFQKFHT